MNKQKIIVLLAILQIIELLIILIIHALVMLIIMIPIWHYAAIAIILGKFYIYKI